MNLSQRIVNPLDDINTIKALIEMSNYNEPLYFKIISYRNVQARNINKEIDIIDYKTRDTAEDKFYSFIFNKMKNNIVSTKNSLCLLMNKSNFAMLQNFLKQIPDISTYKELYNIIEYLNKNNPTLASLLKRLLGERWISESWEQIDSYIINQDWSTFTTEHKLYINADYTNNFEIMTLFIKKCDEYHIPYSFKFDNSAARDDNIVIYASSLYLDKYVAILEEIKHELKLNGLKRPPILSGVINGWIGYGSEPLNGKNSFNEKRSDIIYTAIQKCINNWISAHPSAVLYYNGQKINIQDYSKKSGANLGNIIMQNDDSFIMDVKNEIINIGKEQGIDPNNFAFDIENEKRLNQVETAISHFNSDVTLKALPNLNSKSFKFFLQDGILNIICSDDELTLQQVFEKIKQLFPNFNFNNVLVYDTNKIENQSLCVCGNAIVINNENNEINGLSIIGPNIEKCGHIPFKTIKKENNHSKTI